MKFSNWIRDPGTGGPPTREGIHALGFALLTEIPALFAKYVRVDSAQAFSGPEKAQGRANLGLIIGTDVQAYDAALASLAALTTAADKMLYTTAPDVYATTDLTSYARTLLDDANAAAARTTLGLGTIATQAANAAAITGGTITGITDIAVADGGTGSSTPSGARTNLGVAIGTDVQAFDDQLTAVAGLTGVAGSFIRWTAAAAAVMQAIVGTVSQSAGVPTGAIIETGSNADGRYTKYADGTMICTKSIALGTVGFSASGSVFISSAQNAGNFAAAFSAAPVVTPVVRGSTGTIWPIVSVAPSTTSFGQYYVMSSISSSSTGTVLDLVAVGRWF